MTLRVPKSLVALVIAMALPISSNAAPPHDFNPRTLEGKSAAVDTLRHHGFMPAYSYVPDKQTAEASNGFWCREARPVFWAIELRSDVAVAVGIETQNSNDRD